MAEVPDSSSYSDGDMRASSSSWPTRRARQKQAASNYARVLGRIAAMEEHSCRVVAQRKELSNLAHNQLQMQQNIDNISLRLQMLEGVYVFMDWQKVSALVEERFNAGPARTEASSPYEGKASCNAPPTHQQACAVRAASHPRR